MAKVVASGPAPISRASRLGEMLGAGLGTGIQEGYQAEKQLLTDIEQFNPVRDALSNALDTQPALTPGQLMIKQMAGDPRQFARFMGNPQNIANVAGAAQLATGPETGSEFPTLEEINETMARIDSAEAAGETRRVEVLESRLKDLAGIEDRFPNHSLVQRRLPSGEFQTLWADSEGQNFFDMGRNPVELGPNDVVIENATLTGGAADILPPSEATRDRDQRTTVENFIATTDDALQMLEANPDVATWTGRASSFVNDIQAEGKAIMRNLGYEFDENVLDPETNAETFDDLGIQNNRWRGLVNSLAFRAAAAEAAQTGRSVSNEDVKRFITIIGAGGADARAIAANLTDVANRVERDYRTAYKNRFGNELTDDLGLSSLPTVTGDPVEIELTSVEDVDAQPLKTLDAWIRALDEESWQALPAEIRARATERILTGE